MTFPQLRALIAKLLHAASRCHLPARIARECTKRLQRNQLAKFYHYKRRNLLAPLPRQSHLIFRHYCKGLVLGKGRCFDSFVEHQTHGGFFDVSEARCRFHPV
jgi:hypothetical protein